MQLSKSKADIVSSIAVIVLALIILILIPYQVKGEGDVAGPRFFPRAVATCLFVLGSMLFLKTLISKSGSKDSGGKDSGGSVSFDKNVLLPTIVFGLSAWFLGTLGFLIVGFLVLAILMVLFGEREWKAILILSITTPFLIWWLFSTLLYVFLPLGPFSGLLTR